MAVINGKNTSEVLTGTPFNDVISGFGGNDRLFGLERNDVLDGGKFRDRLEGGSGADTFKISSQADSPNTGTGINGDTILDFNALEGDVIDLSGVDADVSFSLFSLFDQSFRTSQISYSNGVLRADVIGGPNVEIELAGAPSLNILTDIIL